MTKRPFTPEQFKDIYSRVPRLCIELVIRGPAGILLALRSLPTWHNQWHLPGGTLLYGESVEEAVHRIAHDEVGLSVMPGSLLGYLEYPSEIHERGFGQSVGMAFLCEAGTEIPRPDDGAFEVKFFDVLPENLNTEQCDFLKFHWKEIHGTRFEKAV